MKIITSLLLVAAFLAVPFVGFAQKTGRPRGLQLQSPQNPRIGFVIHGGAGVIPRGRLTFKQEKAYRAKLEEAVLGGYNALKEGKTGLDAVEIAIRILEDSPLFNAGKGAVFTADGKNELEASIMDGKSLNAGAVAGLHRVKNPITLARAVMDRSPHVMMIGEGAERFAEEMKIELVTPKYYFTQRRWDSLQKIIEAEQDKKKKDSAAFSTEQDLPENRFGTVGAVALDKDGNLAAGTSTGGMTYKKYGRVGDVPVIGAGTYADNATCAVSATGWGEFFIRLTVARDIAALMEYRALSVQQAADAVIQQKLQKAGGGGGVIAIDKFGNIGISFNSEGMYRAYIDKEGKPVVEIYKD
ncbi:isoaspartyl peptidase/L-asparaginase family protein [Legionella yabuuchiae]|uniref:isoaspartyl peptidase/L-asparaginase family protein n=1 Tax=Legionella yabuuchiae TaxID=376727 RepID=UPI0010558EAD|nr:isoaspartyl peptidase/L-asparaginase [Legionella yabuuchiae]